MLQGEFGASSSIFGAVLCTSAAQLMQIFSLSLPGSLVDEHTFGLGWCRRTESERGFLCDQKDSRQRVGEDGEKRSTTLALKKYILESF